MFWYVHVYFYLFYVLLVITHLFKSNSWERKHYRMNNVNKQDKENKFFCVYTSRNILLIPRIYIHRKYCKLRYTYGIWWNVTLYQSKIHHCKKQRNHLPRLLKGRTLTATLILSVAILFDCVAVRLVFVSSPPQLTLYYPPLFITLTIKGHCY